VAAVRSPQAAQRRAEVRAPCPVNSERALAQPGIGIKDALKTAAAVAAHRSSLRNELDDDMEGEQALSSAN
jgi:hypothetical protein